MSVVGICSKIECPLASGEGGCVEGHQPIDCDNFEPAPGDVRPVLGEAFEPDANPSAESETLPKLDGRGVSMDPPERPSETQAESAGFDDTAGEEVEPAQADVPTLAAGVLNPADDATPTTQADAGTLESLGTAAVAGAQDPQMDPPTGPRNQLDMSVAGEEFRPSSELSGADAAVVLREERSNLIVPIGLPGTGKSTILAAIFEQLVRAPVGGWSFAGSQTLLAYLRLCFYASSAAPNELPTTVRTRRWAIETPWLHLRINDGTRTQTLLTANVSGESFQEVPSGGELDDVRGIVARADHALHIVDSAMFVDSRQRLRALTRSRDMIWRLLEQNAFSPEVRHTIVLTKADLCPDSFRGQLAAELDRWREDWLPDAGYVETAARPGDHTEPRGLEDLLAQLARPAGSNLEGLVPTDAVEQARRESLLDLGARPTVEIGRLLEREGAGSGADEDLMARGWEEVS